MNFIRKYLILGIVCCLILLSNGSGLYGIYQQNQTGIAPWLEGIVAETKNNRELAWLFFWQQPHDKEEFGRKFFETVVRSSSKNPTIMENCLLAAVACGHDKLAKQCLNVFIPDKQLQYEIEKLAEYPCSKSGERYEVWCKGATAAINKMKEVVTQFETNT